MVVNTDETRDGHSVTLVFESKADMKRFFAHASLPWKGGRRMRIVMVKLTVDESQTRLSVEETEKELPRRN